MNSNRRPARASGLRQGASGLGAALWLGAQRFWLGAQRFWLGAQRFWLGAQRFWLGASGLVVVAVAARAR